MTQTTKNSAKPAIELMPPSILMRVGRRRLTLTWRPRLRLPSLLSGLLQRSWKRVLAPALKVSIAAAAVCGAWQMPALAAAPAPGTLPAGWSVVNGNITFTQNGNTLNINQLSPQAIANFVSFSIGSDATVNVNQPSSLAALLARVTGGDISQIYGKLTAPGTVVLYNPNGLVIGPGGMVDVGRFVGTTLNISDSDFLAGKFNFVKQGTAGVVDNQGTIQSATGGSVYLVGSSVTNSGVIRSPGGEVILGAGDTVTLADTATPGVTVKVTGSAGSVTNLGAITADAGRIGVAAGLINNSGVISASSAVKEGGRVFLRASANLTTAASSSITADGTVGGNITLYSDGGAFIDGDVSATGAPGHGGFVETSGLKQLDVVKVPTVGTGGTWLIDPYDLEVVAAGTTQGGSTSCGTYAVTSAGASSKVLNTTINSQLSSGVNVELSTGGVNGGSEAGNITVTADIAKTGNSNVTLTLKADNNININANITSADYGMLALDMVTNANDISSAEVRTVTIGNGAHVMLNGGRLSVIDGNENSVAGNLVIANGSLSGAGVAGGISVGNLTVGANGSWTLSDNTQVDIGNTLTNNGTINVTGYVNLTATGGIVNNGNLTIGANGNLEGNSSELQNAGNITLNGGELHAYSITNAITGLVAGNGSIYTTSTKGFSNGGTLAPGGNGTIGSLNINGSYFQTEDGSLLIDIAGIGDTDTINFNGQSAEFGGTLRTRFVSSYVAQVGDAFSPFSFSESTDLNGSYFRYVKGDIITVGGAKQMVKALYDNQENGIGLRMMGSEVITSKLNENVSVAIAWNDRTTWSSAYIPTEIDSIVIASGSNVSHASGTDTVEQLTINSGGTLGISDSNLTVANVTALNGVIDARNNSTLSLVGTLTGSGTLNITSNQGEGELRGFSTLVAVSPSTSTTVNIENALSNVNVTLDGGNLNLNGSVRIDGLTVSGGNVTGAAGSRLNVAESFSQTGGTLTLADAALSSSCGTLSVGNITANNLVLESQYDDITQNSDTSLHVKTQLIAKAATGIDLSGGSDNQIAAFAANNSGQGDIKLTNSLNTTDTSSVILNGVSTVTGNITIDNTGAMQTAAIGTRANFLGNLPSNANGTAVSTASKLALLGINSTGQTKTTTGNVTLTTHSPLTIGSGGISAGGSIGLTAGAANDPSSNLGINGVLSGGNINLTAGNNLNVNANVVSTGTYTTSATGTLAYGAGVSITTPTGTTIPNPNVSSNTGTSTVSNSNIAQSQNQQAQNLQSTVNGSQSGSGSSGEGDVQQSGGSSQGTASGSFGDDSDNKSNSQGNKKLPVCT
jgi:filamentous hemagglutinin family protein